MKITKRQLRKLIKEACGDAVEVVSAPVIDEPALELDVALEPAAAMSESTAPEQDLMVEQLLLAIL